MTAVGFEPTQLALVELESTPLYHSGKLSSALCGWLSQCHWHQRRGTLHVPLVSGALKSASWCELRFVVVPESPPITGQCFSFVAHSSNWSKPHISCSGSEQSELIWRGSPAPWML